MDTFLPALVTLNNLQKAGVTMQTLVSHTLTVPTVNQWLADSLHSSFEITLPIATLIFQKKSEMPVLVKLFLQQVYEKQLLKRIHDHWQWNLDSIRQLPVADNVISFMLHHLQQLPLSWQDTLQFASCLSSCFSVKDLQSLLQKNVYSMWIL